MAEQNTQTKTLEETFDPQHQDYFGPIHMACIIAPIPRLRETGGKTIGCRSKRIDTDVAYCYNRFGEIQWKSKTAEDVC